MSVSHNHRPPTSALCDSWAGGPWSFLVCAWRYRFYLFLFSSSAISCLCCLLASKLKPRSAGGHCCWRDKDNRVHTAEQMKQHSPEHRNQAEKKLFWSIFSDLRIPVCECVDEWECKVLWTYKEGRKTLYCTSTCHLLFNLFLFTILSFTFLPFYQQRRQKLVFWTKLKSMVSPSVQTRNENRGEGATNKVISWLWSDDYEHKLLDKFKYWGFLQTLSLNPKNKLTEVNPKTDRRVPCFSCQPGSVSRNEPVLFIQTTGTFQDPVGDQTQIIPDPNFPDHFMEEKQNVGQIK